MTWKTNLKTANTTPNSQEWPKGCRWLVSTAIPQFAMMHLVFLLWRAFRGWCRDLWVGTWHIRGRWMRACQKNVNGLASSEIKVLLAIQLIFVTLMKPHRYRRNSGIWGAWRGGQFILPIFSSLYENELLVMSKLRARHSRNSLHLLMNHIGLFHQHFELAIGYHASKILSFIVGNSCFSKYFEDTINYAESKPF